MNSRLGHASYRDRTQEFRKTVENFRKSFSSAPDTSSSSSSAPYLDGPKSAVPIQSEFNRRASNIGLGIHQTSQKLAKLAKCKSTFGMLFSLLLIKFEFLVIIEISFNLVCLELVYELPSVWFMFARGNLDPFIHLSCYRNNIKMNKE